MLKGKYCVIETVGSLKNQYIIKDRLGITIGRIFIVDVTKESMHCIFRLKFYRGGQDYNKTLSDILTCIFNHLVRDLGVKNINIIVSESININPLLELGCFLEGIISNAIVEDNKYKNELVFGLSKETYESGTRTNIIRLTGKDIYLKVLTPENVEEILDYYTRNRDYLKQYEPEREEHYYTLDGQRENLINEYKQFLNRTSMNFGIYNEENILIGKIQLSNIVFGVFKNAFVGYSMDKEYQNRGYMKQALKLIINYCFNDLKLHRIEAFTLVDNIKSQRVLKSCGFNEVGINRKYMFVNGKWRDHITYCIISE